MYAHSGQDARGVGRARRSDGYLERIVINENTGRMIAGHGRCETLTQKKRNGNEPPKGVTADGGEWLVPVDYVTVPADEEYATAIALNRITELGGWDDQTLAAVLTDLAAKGDEAFDGIGYDQEDLDDLLSQLTVIS